MKTTPQTSPKSTRRLQPFVRLTLIILVSNTLLLFTSGCATNPVTGKSELSFVGTAQEIAIGQKQYLPSQQAQGGDLAAWPSVTAYVQRVGDKLVKVSDRPELPYEFVVLNNSTPNAWALPGGKMAINRGLLTEIENEAELAAVLAHEIVHAAARHGAKSMERGILLQGTLGVASAALSGNDYRDLILTGANAGAVLGTTKYGRNAEFEADKYGVKYMVAAGYDPQGAVTLQQKFMAMHNENNPSWLAGMFASHPPSSARVARNKELAKDYANGFVGYEEYQRAMSPLYNTEDAYKKLDEGTQALAQNNPGLALDLAKQAIRQAPEEAQFHGLAAQASFQQGRVAEADQHIQKALARNNNFFAFHLQKGKIAEARGNVTQAKQSYLSSLRLMPTATAHHALGLIARQEGDTRNAIEHFRVAATSDTPAGRESRAILSGMEMSTQPQRYIQTRYTLNRQGYLTVNVQNAASIPVKDIVVRVQVGRQSRNLSIPGVLPAGQHRTVSTGFGPYKNEDQLNGQLTSQVIRATAIQ